MVFRRRGALAGAAAVAYGLMVPIVLWYIGLSATFKGLAATLFGGTGSVIGAWSGGLFIGLMEAVAPHLLLDGFGGSNSNQLRDAVTFAILIVVLTIRPTRPAGRT